MVQGVGVTLNERRFIIEHKEEMFPSQIAHILSANFALENGGFRSKDTVKKTIKELEESTV